MIVHGGNRVFPRGRPRVRAGSTVRVRLLPVLHRQGREVDEMCQRVRETLEAVFAEMEARYGQGAPAAPLPRPKDPEALET